MTLDAKPSYKKLILEPAINSAIITLVLGLLIIILYFASKFVLYLKGIN